MIYWETFQVEELSNKHVTELLGICALVIGVEYFTKKQAEPERLCYLVQEIVVLLKSMKSCLNKFLVTYKEKKNPFHNISV